MKKDRFFANVTDWTRKLPGFDDQSQYLLNAIVEKVPLQHRAIFTNDASVADDGFAMLHRLVDKLQGNNIENQLLAISDLATLEFKAEDTAATYMARVRGLQQALQGVTIDQFLVLLTLSRLDKDLYPGVMSLFRQANAALLADSLSGIETRLDKEDRLRTLEGITPEAARRAKTSKTPNPSPKPDSSTVIYPPVDCQINWSLIKEFTKDTTNCPGCFGTNRSGERCRKGYCYPFLTAGFLLQYNPDEANKKIQELKDKKTERKPRGRGRRATDNDDAPPKETPAPAPSPDPATQKEVVGSGKRATSVDNKTPQSYAEAAQQPATQSKQSYYDALESDSDDDIGLFVPDDNDNHKTASSSYSVASARRATTISSVFSTVAKDHLQHIKMSQKSADEAYCCADSGATRHMFPDYKTFVSYHPCHNKTVLLGDSTELPILGYGTAKFSLNGHVILVRNALHVPGLTDPLYSLRQHRFMQGCGVFSHHDSGAFLLFPNFAIKIDDRVDCLLNFKAIGRQSSSKIAYAEPRSSSSAFDAARPAHLIEPDDPSDEDDDLDKISYHIPTPKTTSVPQVPTQPTTPSATASPEPTVIEQSDLEASASKPLTKRIMDAIHHNPRDLPPIPPSYTPAACENRTTFDALKLHKIFGCRKFRTQSHLISASKNASLLAGGEFPPTIGDFASITMPARGKPITKRRKFLDKVHMDIVYGDCVALGGYRYALLLVDVATRYTWIYGMQTTSAADIILALEAFKADTGTYPKTYHADFDQKLIGGAALRYINKHSRIIAAPARRQSSNGLVEATWKTIVRMARAYITEKQVSREFWFFAVRHAVIMINQVPGRLGRRLTTPFELVHGTKPDSSTWFELFSIGYFDHKTEGSSSKSNTEAQTLAGIAVGRDEKANTIRFYNPLTKSYYSPPVFKLDEGRLPASHFPNRITFDGGLVCGLQSRNTDPAPEPFPPGTRVNLLLNGHPKRGTIQNIPLPSSLALEDSAVITPDGSIESEATSVYTVLLDDGTTTELTYKDLISPSASQPAVDPLAPST
eukprot:scaffold88129_cov23-Cyclotella_meneghiniana.AAC.1